MTDEPGVRHGGCFCGAVRYTLRGAPIKVGLCHCADCRKFSGSAFLFYADWPRSAFDFSGSPREYHGRNFCPDCGARLFHLSPDEVEVELGSLDDAPTDLVPTREGWICRREPWLVPVAGASQSDRDPPKDQQ